MSVISVALVPLTLDTIRLLVPVGLGSQYWSHPWYTLPSQIWGLSKGHKSGDEHWCTSWTVFSPLPLSSSSLSLSPYKTVRTGLVIVFKLLEILTFLAQKQQEPYLGGKKKKSKKKKKARPAPCLCSHFSPFMFLTPRVSLPLLHEYGPIGERNIPRKYNRGQFLNNWNKTFIFDFPMLSPCNDLFSLHNFGPEQNSSSIGRTIVTTKESIKWIKCLLPIDLLEYL